MRWRDDSYTARGGEPSVERDEAMQHAFPPLVAMTSRELYECVKEWAEREHAEKVAHVKAQEDPAMVRRLIIRLIELRWESDTEWRLRAPLLALHETRIVTKMRHKGTGIEFAVCGRRAPRPWVWTFAELANFTRAVDIDTDAGFAMLVRAKHHLDLEHVG